MFITFEGIEGCGKSTQSTLLAQWLKNHGWEVQTTREPGGSRLGQNLRSILLSMESRDLTGESELFLYLADRAQHVHQTIKPALDKGAVVLSDRFADSTVVYQGYGRGLDPNLLHTLNDVAVQGVWPDLTLLFDLPVELGLKRAMARNFQDNKTEQEGRFEAESLAFHSRVREGYLTWAALNKNRFQVVDAEPDPETIFNEVQRILRHRFPKWFPE
ncbi:dTMP kinase [Desulfohalobium retbaense]|uniref:Thymidylate kinase n=1 Tax=Desulfohalobium retbaense (strain ATCC 49708 / DSM 5692 / JCM 16813 / HR100) TaxID=485915 RepID=C8X2P5_DESRD|nr:dTMP kinase [Desulfohalobium retbaense]ACV68692.1 thymidylate kinase [Desulfohalobium retbaense DSM 5692]